MFSTLALVFECNELKLLRNVCEEEESTGANYINCHLASTVIGPADATGTGPGMGAGKGH
jgi:hypothetical protein